MAKYNIMILDRMTKDNLIVQANKLVKRPPPIGGGDETTPKEPRLTSFQRMVLERFDRIESRLGNVEQRLDKLDERVTTLESRWFKISKLPFLHEF